MGEEETGGVKFKPERNRSCRSTRSAVQAARAWPDLIRLFERAGDYVDITIVEGHQSNERQEELFRQGKSKLGAGRSKHNASPSMAVDAAPYPMDWRNIQCFAMFAGFIKGLAAEMGIPSPLTKGADMGRVRVHKAQIIFLGANALLG